MTIGLCFWILMVIWFVFGIFGVMRPFTDNRFYYGHGLLAFVLFFLIGWKVFGFVIRDDAGPSDTRTTQPDRR